MISSTNEKQKLPERYESVKYNDVPKNIREKLETMHKTRKGVYLFGECGTGKTHIVYAVMKHCIEKNIRAWLYNSPELLDVIRDFYGKNSYDYRDNNLLRLMDYKGLLIIDDIGVEKPTEWVAETFYKIINKRYEEMLPTIFTSNHSLAELSEKMGDRVPSRIAEMCEIIKLDGVDRRL